MTNLEVLTKSMHGRKPDKSYSERSFMYKLPGGFELGIFAWEDEYWIAQVQKKGSTRVYFKTTHEKLEKLREQFDAEAFEFMDAIAEIGTHT